MRVGEQFYVRNVLLIELASAPRDFSFVIKKVLAFEEAWLSDAVSVYIDDTISFALSLKEAYRVPEIALDLLYKFNSSSLTPRTRSVQP